MNVIFSADGNTITFQSPRTPLPDREPGAISEKRLTCAELNDRVARIYDVIGSNKISGAASRTQAHLALTDIMAHVAAISNELNELNKVK